jgi:hypothetical protein
VKFGTAAKDYELVAKDRQMTQNKMKDKLHINPETIHRTLREKFGEEHLHKVCSIQPQRRTKERPSHNL